MFNQNPRQHVARDLGNGTVRYEGAHGNDYPEFSVWAITFYGGVVLSEHSHDPDEQSRLLYGITASNEFLLRSAIVSIFGGPLDESIQHPDTSNPPDPDIGLTLTLRYCPLAE